MALTKAQREILKEEKKNLHNEENVFRILAGLSGIVLILDAINVINFELYIVALAMIGVIISWFKISRLGKYRKKLNLNWLVKT